MDFNPNPCACGKQAWLNKKRAFAMAQQKMTRASEHRFYYHLVLEEKNTLAIVIHIGWLC
jgi:hypothetical protein